MAPLERLIGVRGIDEVEPRDAALTEHVIVIGYGLAGAQTATALLAIDVPFVVLELNAERVRSGKHGGLPIYYADATSEEALRHAHVERARLVVLLINDTQAAQRVVDTIKRVARPRSVKVRCLVSVCTRCARLLHSKLNLRKCNQRVALLASHSSTYNCRGKPALLWLAWRATGRSCNRSFRSSRLCAAMLFI